MNLEIEILVNGRKIKTTEKLNTIISDYLLEKIGALEETPILDNIVPKVKFPKAKVYGESKKLVMWTDEETLKFAQRAEEVRLTGVSFSQVARELETEFNRSSTALYMKIQELKKKGIIKII